MKELIKAELKYFKRRYLIMFTVFFFLFTIEIFFINSSLTKKMIQNSFWNMIFMIFISLFFINNNWEKTKLKTLLPIKAVEAATVRLIPFFIFYLFTITGQLIILFFVKTISYNYWIINLIDKIGNLLLLNALLLFFRDFKNYAYLRKNILLLRIIIAFFSIIAITIIIDYIPVYHFKTELKTINDFSKTIIPQIKRIFLLLLGIFLLYITKYTYLKRQYFLD